MVQRSDLVSCRASSSAGTLGRQEAQAESAAAHPWFYHACGRGTNPNSERERERKADASGSERGACRQVWRGVRGRCRTSARASRKEKRTKEGGGAGKPMMSHVAPGSRTAHHVLEVEAGLLARLGHACRVGELAHLGGAHQEAAAAVRERPTAWRRPAAGGCHSGGARQPWTQEGARGGVGGLQPGGGGKEALQRALQR